MARFICKDCNYRFEIETENIPKKCPYCGEENIRKEKSAEEIVNNAKFIKE